jgi:hypothetical protein
MANGINYVTNAFQDGIIVAPSSTAYTTAIAARKAELAGQTTSSPAIKSLVNASAQTFFISSIVASLNSFHGEDKKK